MGTKVRMRWQQATGAWEVVEDWRWDRLLRFYLYLDVDFIGPLPAPDNAP